MFIAVTWRITRVFQLPQIVFGNCWKKLCAWFPLYLWGVCKLWLDINSRVLKLFIYVCIFCIGSGHSKVGWKALFDIQSNLETSRFRRYLFTGCLKKTAIVSNADIRFSLYLGLISLDLQKKLWRIDTRI